MQTDSLLNQPRAREVDLASLRSGTWTRQAPIKARRPPFDRLTIGLHWGTVLLVLVLFASAWLTRQSHFTPILLQIHRSSGVTIWVVTALRLAWRVTKASLPPFPKQISKLHRATAKLTEYGLYALLLGEPATGLLTTLFGGRPFALYLWQFPALMPRDLTLQAAFHFSHELGAGRMNSSTTDIDCRSMSAMVGYAYTQSMAADWSKRYPRIVESRARVAPNCL